MRVAQAIAVVGSDPSVILFDDFGEGLDGAGATHLASVLRSADAQVWLSTRRPKVAGAFDADELVRLTIGDDGRRHVHQGEVPSTKSERLARRYEAQQLLPAIASRAVAVVEGPHDFAALSALSERLFRVRGLPKLAAHRIELMDSGLGAGGGDTRVPALGRAASEMGLFSIGVIDWDRDAEKATDRLTAAETGCDAVIRLPEGFAIERLLWEGVSEKAVRAGLKPLMKAFGAKSPRNGIDDLAGADLFKAMRRALKSSSGLHAQYIDALPLKALPPLAIELLELVVSVASSRTTGVHQLEAG